MRHSTPAVVVDFPRIPAVVRRYKVSTLDRCLSCDARSTSICDALTESDLTHLARIAIPMVVRPGASLLGEGCAAEDFYTVSAGTGMLFKLLVDGRRQITGFVHRGDFLGLAVSSVYAFSVEALEILQICRYPRAQMSALFAEYPLLARRVLDRASTELVAAQEQMMLLGRKSAVERLASFLLDEHARTRSSSWDDSPIFLPMAHVDIADYLGLTLETICRNFARLRKAGAIAQPSRGQIIVLDRLHLMALASGDRQQH